MGRVRRRWWSNLDKMGEDVVTQNHSSTFDFDKFVSLSGCELWDYIPTVTESRVPEAVVERIIEHLSSFDEEHLAFALEISYTYEGDAFTPLIPQYLAHSSQSVRLAASRKLQHLDKVSPEVYELVKQFAPQCREREIAEDIIDRVSKKVR